MLGEFVEGHRDEILELAASELRGKIPGHPDAEVVDHLPGVVDQIIGELRGDPRDSLANHARIELAAAQHGRQRERLGIDISQVAMDYGVVCDAISEHAKRHNLTIPAAEWQKLNWALDVGIAGSLASYWDEWAHDHERQPGVHMGSVAHEMRNSVHAVAIAFQTMKNGLVGISSRTGEVLERHLRHLAELADDLLSASRISAGVTLTKERIVVRQLVKDIVEYIPNARGLRVDIDVFPEGLSVFADRRLVESAVNNLVQNAIKFTQPTGQVFVRAFADEARCTIEVEDRCGGLPGDQIEAMFVPFVQQRGADRSGAGLGLWIVQQAAAAHGGTVSVRSIPDQGCVFTIQIPRDPEPVL